MKTYTVVAIRFRPTQNVESGEFQIDVQALNFIDACDKVRRLYGDAFSKYIEVINVVTNAYSTEYKMHYDKTRKQV